MKYPRIVINWSLSLVVSILLLAPGHAQSASDNVLVKAGQKVVFLGDSVTGLGWSVPGGYINLVVSGLEAQGIKVTPIPAGVGGNTSREMLARLDHDVLSAKPDWMTLSCGVNDVWGRERGVDLETYKKNVASIVDKAEAAGIKVMILTATPIYEVAITEFSPKLDLYNDFLRQFAKERKLPLADVNAAWMNAMKDEKPRWGTRFLTIDGVHPNPDGHRLMAQAILEAFGLSPDQVATAEEKWLDAPGSATIQAGVNLLASDPITLRQYDALKKVAANRKITTFDLINTLYLEAIRDTLQAHGQLSSSNKGPIENQIQAETQVCFDKKIDALK